MELISGVGHVEFHFSPFGDSVNVSAREVHGLHRTYHRLKWKLASVHFETVLPLMHDWCTVCVKRTVGSEIVLEAPDGTLS
jgi:hypothetical protein